MSRYERIVFIQNEEAAEPLEIYDDQGSAAAIEYLSNWHYPGEHETSDERAAGTADDVTDQDGYILVVNSELEYIGLEYDTEYEEAGP